VGLVGCGLSIPREEVCSVALSLPLAGRVVPCCHFFRLVMFGGYTCIGTLGSGYWDILSPFRHVFQLGKRELLEPGFYVWTYLYIFSSC